jgi:hypothetical protein
MEKPKRSSWITVLVIGVILAFLCLCALVVGGATAFFLSGSGLSLPERLEINLGDGMEPNGEEEQPVPTVPAALESQPTIQLPEPAVPEPAKPTPRKATVVKTPTQTVEMNEPGIEPPMDEPVEPPIDQPAEGPALTGKQEWSDNRIFDDFSSNSMDWFQYDSDTYSILVDKGAYNIHIKEADESAWADFPVDFVPYEFNFDVRGPAGEQDGGFGVDCQYTDDDNMYFVEFDLGTGEYTIAAEKDSVITPLTKKNAQGQYWQKTTALKSPASSVNHIAISCYLESITLFINNKLVDQVTVKDPLSETGTANLYVYTFKSVEGDGYKVTFDNVEAYQPRQ